jgi:hypothetical protein
VKLDPERSEQDRSTAENGVRSALISTASHLRSRSAVSIRSIVPIASAQEQTN